MARTSPISGPLSFLIVALAAVFLNPEDPGRGLPVAEGALATVEEVGPPLPEGFGEMIVEGESPAIAAAEEAPIIERAENASPAPAGERGTAPREPEAEGGEKALAETARVREP